MHRSTELTVLAFFFVLFSTVPVFPQSNTTALSGRAVDPQGAGLAGAIILLDERVARTRLTTATDDTGSFRFSPIAPGDYLVTIESPGFARTVRQARIPRGAEASLNLTLAVAGLNEIVIVTASGTPQSAEEASKAVSVVSADEIERRAEYSLGESLRLAPGLRVQQLGGPGSLTTIKTRGLRNEDTAVLIDGMRFRDASTIGGDASALISDLLVVNSDHLEVLRGSGSSLYGSNAIGGLVNLMTDQGGGPACGQVQLEGGSLGLFRGRGRIAGGQKEGRLLYSAGLAHLNVTRGVDRDAAAHNTSGQGFVKYLFKPSLSLSGRVMASDVFLRLNDSPFAAPPANLPTTGNVRAIPLSPEQQRLREAGLTFTLGNATFIPDLDDPDNRREARYFTGAVMLAHQVNEAVSWHLAYQGLATHRAFLDGTRGVRFEPLFNTASTFDGRIDTIYARADLRAGRHQLISAGYEFERELYDNSSRDENPDPARRLSARTKATQRSHTVFAQDQVRLLNERLQLSAAFRGQFFELSRPEFFGGAPRYAGISFDAPPNAHTGDGSISYFFGASGTKLRAHGGSDYRAPSLFQRFGSSFFGGSFSAFGDPRLRPDRSIAFDAGLDQTMARGRVRASATYFYTRLQEVIEFDFSGLINPATDPFGRSSGYRNIGGGLARGVELSLTAAPTASLNVMASYTYTNADQRTPTSVGGFIPSFGISNHLFTVYANQRAGKRVDVTCDLFASSDYPIPFSGRAFIFDGPVKADLGASYTLPLSDDRRARLYAKVDNVLNRTHFENGYRTPRAAFTGGMSFHF